MKLLHMYQDIMNLYGDYANVDAMRRILEESGETVEAVRLNLGDKVVLDDYDFVYIGSGTERNLKFCLLDLMQYKEQLRAYIFSGKPLLMTGNSFEMLGKSITNGSGYEYDALGLYPYVTAEVNELRQTSDVICTADFLDEPLVGFINRSDEIFGIEDHLFQVEFGIGDRETYMFEGIRDRNFFGTHLIGPVLIKNPHFLSYIAALILGREPSTAHLEYERKGYEITLKKLKEREQE